MFSKNFHLILSWLINSGLFYLGWILTLKFVLEGEFWQGPLINLGIILLHLARVPHKLFEGVLVLTVPLLGAGLDAIFVSTGVLNYIGGYESCPCIAPLWVMSLWALFATSFNHSLSWLDKNIWICIGVGSIGGTVSYMAGIRVGVAYFSVPEWVGITSLAIGWGIVVPLCYCYNRWLKSKLVKEEARR